MNEKFLSLSKKTSSKEWTFFRDGMRKDAEVFWKHFDDVTRENDFRKVELTGDGALR